MLAVVFRGEKDVRVEDVPEPELVAADDAIVKVRTAAVCGSDLHIFHGRVPGVFEGATLGHELVGEIVALGEGVTRFSVGDDVIVSFQISDGTCDPCRAGRFNNCDDMGTLGYGVFVGDLGGAQAELVRVPHADVNLLAKPADLPDDKAIWIGDVLTTGWYAASIARICEGDTVLVVGAGPVGLCAAMAAQQMGAGQVVVTDMVADRLALAAELGCKTINSAEVSVAVAIESFAPARADVVIESVGLLPALLTAIDCVRTGGTVSVIGVHTEFEATLPLMNLFARNITLAFGGSCNVQGVWEEALHAVQSGAIDPSRLVTHRMPLSEAVEGYRLFDEKKALKVLLDVG